MTTEEINQRSFRDPSGHIFEHDNKIYRTVMPGVASDFQAIRQGELLPQLIAHHKLLGESTLAPLLASKLFPSAYAVLEHPKLDFWSYPYEWPFSLLQSAACLTLDILLQALEENVSLSDASAYNVQFQGINPIFIDHLSFIPYKEGDRWQGHQQFYDHFLNPLLCFALTGMPYHALYRGNINGLGTEDLAKLLHWRDKWRLNVIMHVLLPARFQQRKYRALAESKVHQKTLPKRSFVALVQSLLDWIASLSPRGMDKTVWHDYTTNNNYDSSGYQEKKDFIAEFVQKTGANTVWDLGCNTGEFSEVCLGHGAQRVIGFDVDHGALEGAVARAKAKSLNFTPLYANICNPTPAQGWGLDEMASIQSRANPDGLIALALIHHIAISNNVPLHLIIDHVVSLAPAGVIEFIPKEDSMVQHLLALREDIFEDYSRENFESLLSAKATIVKTQTLDHNQRTLFWYQSK